MTNALTALMQAAHPKVVVLYLGQLALMLALLNAVPLVVALAFGELIWAWRLGLLVVLLVAFARHTRRFPVPARLQANEALAVVALAFVITPLLATWPFMASDLAFEDALFEAVSAITTTGLSTAGSTPAGDPVFLFTRAWMQWYGGLGIAVLSVALLMGHHAAARRLVEPAESENLAITARLHARGALGAYLALTLIGILLLWAFIGDPFSALLYMLATLSTGGFAPSETSLAALPPAGAWLVSTFSVIGAVPLLLFYGAARGRAGELLRDPEVRALGIVVLAAVVLLCLSLHYHAGFEWSGALQHGAWLGISAQTTTGFSSTNVAELDPTSKALMIVSMAVGGATGSTAGGVKLLRLLVLISLLLYYLRGSAMPPHAAHKPRLGGRALEPESMQRAALVILLFGGFAGLCWLAFLAGGFAPMDALFEVTSALGTVGLSTGITNADLHTPLKLLLCAAMLLGRLEFLALLVVLYPRTWLGKRS
ncbi:MAG: potassium transporter TrkG [Pseudomonadales bacterium]